MSTCEWTKERARSLHASAVLILGSGTGQGPVRLDEAFTAVAGRPYMPRNSLIQRVWFFASALEYAASKLASIIVGKMLREIENGP
jgi:hypothetical protein